MPTIIQIIAATGLDIYVFIWNSIGQIWNTSTLTFENYNLSNYVNYAIQTTEQSHSGSYLATIPTGITAVGNYSFAAYIQAGGSPVSPPIDTPIDQGPFAISNSNFSIPSSLIGLIAIFRVLIQDTQDSKLIRGEQLGGADQPMYPVDGTNTTFQLKSIPLSDYFGAPSFSWATIVGNGGAVRSQSLLTIVDPVNGIINFKTAPNPGNGTTTAGIYMDYNHLWFIDAKLAQFIYQGAQMTVAGTTDPTTLPNGLSDVMLQYAAFLAYTALASQYATKYAATAGDSSEHVETVAQTFRNLAKDSKANADKLKIDYYQRQGQRNVAASVSINYAIDPISPRR